MFLRISQFLTWPIAFVYFNLFYKLKIRGRENLDAVASPFIIIVNHFNFDDSFLFRVILGLFSPHLPLRFMAVNRFDWKWLNFLAEIGVIDFVYGLFGVFVVVVGRGLQRNLEEAKRIIISKRQNVVIFPEGGIILSQKIAPFRLGAAVLADETHTPVLPVALRPGRRGLWRRELTVMIGAPIIVTEHATAEETTEVFRDTIVRLYDDAAYADKKAPAGNPAGAVVMAAQPGEAVR